MSFWQAAGVLPSGLSCQVPIMPRNVEAASPRSLLEDAVWNCLPAEVDPAVLLLMYACVRARERTHAHAYTETDACVCVCVHMS